MKLGVSYKDLAVVEPASLDPSSIVAEYVVPIAFVVAAVVGVVGIESGLLTETLFVVVLKSRVRPT